MNYTIKSLQKFNPLELLSFDIETVRGEATLPKDEASPLRRAWSRLRSNQDRTPEEMELAYVEEAALYPEFAKVVAFSAAKIIIDPNSSTPTHTTQIVCQFANDKEMDLLWMIGNFLAKTSGILAGMAITGYDIPFLAKRYIANGMPVPPQLDLSDTKPWEVGIFDLLQIWKITSFHASALESICYAMGVPSPKDGDVDGKSVGTMFYDETIPLQTRLETISAYCDRDTIAVCLIIMKMFRLP